MAEQRWKLIGLQDDRRGVSQAEVLAGPVIPHGEMVEVVPAAEHDRYREALVRASADLCWGHLEKAEREIREALDA